ncbi:inositol monophosphatase family protein [Lentilactobacillus kefiri]|uniref:Inositol monophosphatase n=2 Tax=Lentilactobacillus kefiri TaxID=33962 RepID=A0A8E1RKA8_LENKE|nr:inositol monophosphatase family protein [Lentilactobacillus kefiri]KRL57637.1 inositol monophosphatase [Lentilactobacillus parakefiri DSM 10551]KRM52198.1 inositol monophosphatase [Lentilactobacillus kefiri DSM 20587 = JCM 5818]MCJ2161227.1 inositol monophosphatase family protein [Lentilactobacillus kefiri]MCP9368241.1 inositol monophosphatase family protein [Lentilactobacillus kefiri]MDH5108145.1 inositol monophosphatase family protein [Lentilactobacillus kefiri]
MEINELKHIDKTVRGWLSESRDNVLRKIDTRLTVDTKTSRKDLVTNVDKQNEKFLVGKIREFDPDSKILGEEGFGDQVHSTKGRIWIIDPIDGTMNFVKQRNNFAIMIALYEDGKGVLGYVMDVIGKHLLSGGPDLGVFDNGQPLPPVQDTPLREGLIGLSGPMVLHNDYNMVDIAQQSLGMRIYGSAGIDIVSVLRGELVGYISYLKPWDFGAGRILCETAGLKMTTIDGQRLDVLSSTPVLLATRNAHRDILTIVSK